MSQEANTTEALYCGGYLLAQRKLLREASAIFRMMITVAPNDARGWIGLGFCHEGLNQMEVAKRLYATGIVVAEDPEPCKRSLASLEQKMEHEQATRVVGRRISLFGARAV